MDLDPEAIELAQEIVRIGYPEEKRREMFFGAADSLFMQMASQALKKIDDDGLRDLVADEQVVMMGELKEMMERHIPPLMEALAYAYASEYSVEELRQLHDFVDTPLGRTFFFRNAKLISNPYYSAALEPYFAEVSTMSQEWQTKLIQTIGQYMQEQEAAAKDTGA